MTHISAPVPQFEIIYPMRLWVAGRWEWRHGTQPLENFEVLETPATAPLDEWEGELELE